MQPAPRPAAPQGAWFVVFPRRRIGLARTAWWMRALRPGWRHCFAARPFAQATLVLEHAGTQLDVTLDPAPTGEVLRRCIEETDALVLLVPDRDVEPRAAMRGPMTCVEVVKATLGIRAPFVLTPRALFRHLRRHRGARLVLPATA